MLYSCWQCYTCWQCLPLEHGFRLWSHCNYSFNCFKYLSWRKQVVQIRKLQCLPHAWPWRWFCTETQLERLCQSEQSTWVTAAWLSLSQRSGVWTDDEATPNGSHESQAVLIIFASWKPCIDIDSTAWCNFGMPGTSTFPLTAILFSSAPYIRRSHQQLTFSPRQTEMFFQTSRVFF